MAVAVAQLSMFEEPARPQEQAPTLAPSRVQYGDLWQLGRHRLLCGDSQRLPLPDVDACITDPPYGIGFDVDYRRFTKGLAVNRNWHQPIAGDDKPFNPSPLLGYRAVVLWGANCYASRLPMGSLLVWDKRFKNGKAFLSDAEVAWMKGGHGVYIHSITSQGFVRPERIQHPTQKPIALIEWCMEKAKARHRVYDPYLGSGTTLIACERTGRTCDGAEIEPRYCDVILRRWEQATGQRAVLLKRVARLEASA